MTKGVRTTAGSDGSSLDGTAVSDILVVQRALIVFAAAVLVGAGVVTWVARAGEPAFHFVAWGPGLHTSECSTSADSCAVSVPRSSAGAVTFDLFTLERGAPSTWFVLCATKPESGLLSTRRVWSDANGAVVESRLPSIPFAVPLDRMKLSAADIGLPSAFGTCGVLGQAMTLTRSELSLLEEIEAGSAYTVQTILGLESGGDQIIVESEDFAVVKTPRRLPLGVTDALSATPVTQTSVGGSTSLLVIWGAALGILLLVAMSAVPLLGVSRRATDLAVTAARSQSQAMAILHTAHHEMERELLLTRFAADDLTADGAPTEELAGCLNRLEESKDALTALAHISSDPPVIELRKVAAQMLVPLWIERAVVEVGPGDHTIDADLLLLRTFVRRAINQSEKGGGSTLVRIEVVAGTLILSDDGIARTAKAERWYQRSAGSSSDYSDAKFMREVAAAHNADLIFDESPLGGLQVAFKLRNATEQPNLPSEFRPRDHEVRATVDT